MQFNKLITVIPEQIFLNMQITESFLCSQKGKHIVAALSVRPVSCPANNFKNTGGI